MPYRVTLAFGLSDEVPCAGLGRVLCANFYAWLDAADAELAERVHQDMRAKPFTLSPLTRPRRGKRLLHVSLLDDELWPPFLAGLQRRTYLDVLGREVPLAAQGLEMRYASYTQLARENAEGTYIDLHFVTPTCFRAGDLDQPLPQPHALYQSWLSRWNQYAPDNLRIDDELPGAAWSQVGIADLEIHTETIDLGYGEQVGFVGELSLCIVGAHHLTATRRKELHALASFAEFCGSGRKTTHGMGQTRRLRSS